MSSDILNVRVVSIRATERPVVLRLPFQFGDTVVTETSEAYVEVTLEHDNRVTVGRSAQLMVPRWFDKRADQTNADTVDTLRLSVTHACTLAVGMTGTIADLCAHIRDSVHGHMPVLTPRLASGFGPALVEMALIDALCLAVDTPFFEGARRDIFGLSQQSETGLTGNAIVTELATIKPKWDMQMRHTIGFDAPLTANDLTTAPPANGPVTLQDVISETGIAAFKIKLKGNVGADINRLCAIQPHLTAAGEYVVTLDANEQYAPDAFEAFLGAFRTQRALQELRSATLFVEQPFAREIANETVVSDAKFDLPLMIDESDDSDGAFAQALELGWSGTSVKSCKGVLRALLNYCRVKDQKSKGREVFLSGEDLTCQPGLCLQQDTLMAAAIGVSHAERNGHHFAGGMQGASIAEIERAVDQHSDLYRQLDGMPRLRINNGKIGFSSLEKSGFGDSKLIDTASDALITEC